MTTSLIRFADEFNEQSLGAFTLNLIDQAMRELAEQNRVTLSARPLKLDDGFSPSAARVNVWAAAHDLSANPKSPAHYRELRRAIAQFEHSYGQAADCLKAKRLHKTRHAPDRVAFHAKHAPRQAVLECSSGSAAMANRPIPEPRTLTKEQATAMVTIAKFRYYAPKLCTRQQIAAIENEVLAMNKDQLARWLAISSGRGRFIDLRNI